MLLLLLFSCGGNNDTKETIRFKETAQNASSEVVGTSTARSFYITNRQNEQLAEIVMEGERSTIKLPQGDLYGKLKGEKRKYYDRNNQMNYAVKYKATNSFKLRDQSEQLLWKVKLYDDKVKISDNEEMDSPFQVQLYDGKLKVKQNEQERYVLRFDSSDVSTPVSDKYAVRNFGKSLALGILLIEEIPEQERFLLASELLRKGR